MAVRSEHMLRSDVQLRAHETALHTQIFNGQDGKEKYPRRWIMLPPAF